MHRTFSLETPTGSCHVGDLGVETNVILKWIEYKCVMVLNGINWFRTGFSGDLL